MANGFDFFDFSGGEDLSGGGFYDPGQFDVGSAGEFGFDIPEFAEFDPEVWFGGEPGGEGGELGGYMVDTTTNELVSPSGERTSLSDIVRGGEGGFGREPAAIQVPPGGGGEGGGVFGRDGVFGQGGGVDRFLGSNIGRALATGALGLTGMGLSRLFAGEEPRLRFPQPRVSGPTRAGEDAVMRAFQQGLAPELSRALVSSVTGQRALAEGLRDRAFRETAAEAEQAPLERLARLQALGMLPGLMEPTEVGQFEDPVEAALRGDLLNLLQGTGGVSPGTDRRHQEEELNLRANLHRQLGPEYETTTPGTQALQQLKQRQNEERFFEREASISRRLAPQESRQRFQYLAPVERATGLERLRRGALGDVERLSDFGLRGTPETLTGLRGITGIGTLLGQEGTEQATRFGTEADFQRALQEFGGETRRRRELASAISGLFGRIAEAATSRRSPWDELFSGAY